jgi:hypothetical protein
MGKVIYRLGFLMNLFRYLAPATFKDDGTKRSRRFCVDYGLYRVKSCKLSVFASLSSLLPRWWKTIWDQWGRKLDCWPWSASCLAWLLVRGKKSMICTVMEGLKGGPYHLLWQGLLSCELLAIPAAGNAYSTCTQNTVIIWITQGKQGQVSIQPMSSLWWRTCSLWHENQWYLHSVVTPSVLFPFEPLFFTESILHTNKDSFLYIRCSLLRCLTD